MKLECTVTQVQDQYPHLKLTLRDDASWRNLEIVMPSTKTTRATYHVGRAVLVEVKPA